MSAGLREPARSQVWLAGYVAAAFALSSCTDPRLLSAAAVVALLAFRRGAARRGRVLLVTVVPLAAGLSVGAWAWQRFAGTAPADWHSLLAVNLRAALLGFVTLAVLDRIDPFHAVGRWPSLARLLAIVLGQVHALRLLAAESSLGLRSRLPRRPGAGDVVRGAGAVTASLLSLSARNSRDVADALRSRGI